MKIQGDAETSARTGIPTYNVREEDRQVSWTLNLHNLLQMEAWDKLDWEERRRRQEHVSAAGRPAWAVRLPGEADADFQARLATHRIVYDGWLNSFTDPIDRVAAMHYGSDWLDAHAIVARNALRNFLGTVTAPDRRVRLYDNPASGWMGWIEVNGNVAAWITTDGLVIDDARIDYADGKPIAFRDVDGNGFSFSPPS